MRIRGVKPNLCTEVCQTWSRWMPRFGRREQFGQCDLKDKRRTQRLVQVAASALSHPSGSLPEQSCRHGRFEGGLPSVRLRRRDRSRTSRGRTGGKRGGNRRASIWCSTTPPKWTSAFVASFAAWGPPATAAAGDSCCIPRWWSARKAKRSSVWRGRRFAIASLPRKRRTRRSD